MKETAGTTTKRTRSDSPALSATSSFTWYTRLLAAQVLLLDHLPDTGTYQVGELEEKVEKTLRAAHRKLSSYASLADYTFVDVVRGLINGRMLELTRTPNGFNPLYDNDWLVSYVTRAADLSRFYELAARDARPYLEHLGLFRRTTSSRW